MYKKDGGAKQTKDYNIIRDRNNALCIKGKWGYSHTHRLCKTFLFSTPTVVGRTYLWYPICAMRVLLCNVLTELLIHNLNSLHTHQQHVAVIYSSGCKTLLSVWYYGRAHSQFHEFNMAYRDINCTYLKGTTSTNIEQQDLEFCSAVDTEIMCKTIQIYIVTEIKNTINGLFSFHLDTQTNLSGHTNLWMS